MKNVERFMADKNDVNIFKAQIPFSFEGEISKIKITVPLTELVTQQVYRSQVLKFLNMGNDVDIVVYLGGII